MPNPFRAGGFVEGPDFTDRAAEVTRIRAAMADPGSLLVFGPRRMGKSSAIERAAAHARRDGSIVASADFATATTLTDVSNRLLRSLAAELTGPGERLLEFIRGVRPEISLQVDPATGLPVLSLSADVRTRPVEDQRAAFESVLDRIEGLGAAHDRPVVLVFDEFQEILEIGGERADWFLRGIMQRHQHLSYVCAGSRESLIHRMLERDAAFYKHFELLHVGPIESDHMTTWIRDRMREHGVTATPDAVAAIVQRAGERTQDRVRLAREVFGNGLADGKVTNETVEDAIRDIVRSEAEVFSALWNTLSATHQNALRALASRPPQLYGAEVLSRFGLSSTAALASALASLRDRGVIVQSEHGPSFDNPFFEDWVIRYLLPDTPPA